MGAATPEALIAAYGEAINTHSFVVVAPLIADDASFWFNDGSHLGIAAIRDAFEATWARLVDERYWLEDLNWMVKGAQIAACRYRFCSVWRWSWHLYCRAARAGLGYRPRASERVGLATGT